MKTKGVEIIARCLVGKFLTTRGVNIEGLRSVIHQVWRTVLGVRVESLGENVFMFKFTLEADKRIVLAGEPCYFNKALIVLTEPEGIGNITKQAFTHVSFWVQILNIPIMAMNIEANSKLGIIIVSVEEVETNEDGECIGEITRVQIRVDDTKPLKKIIFLESEGEEKVPMRVIYERLPNFCFYFGIIDHQFRECVKYKTHKQENFAFGPWMKPVTVFERLNHNKSKDRWNKSNNTRMKKNGQQNDMRNQNQS
ncbi:hypothetical protein WN943_018571 [Citrus x changshan-huyou]